MKKPFVKLCALVFGMLLINVTVFANENGDEDIVSPEVIHTGTTPTGYEVTFRYDAPDAKKVQLKGEWYFSRPGTLDPFIGTADETLAPSHGILPTDWQPGDFPISHPNSTSPLWPVVDMKKGDDDIWTYTIPLPSGVFTYQFFVDPPEDPAQAQPVSDPLNPPWNEKDGTLIGPKVPNSQVFVPSDPAFDTVDYWWMGPADEQGELTHHTYSSERAIDGENYYVVYTPPHYDPDRAVPYPTLYLSHGGGEDEMGWTTQGDARNILDNLISTGQIEALVCVMPMGSRYENDLGNLFDDYDHDIIEKVIPLVEEEYHVSTNAEDRAFSGLSKGGMLTNSFIFKYPETFTYYGVMSAGIPPVFLDMPDALIAELKTKGIFVGTGWQDPINFGFWINPQLHLHTGPFLEIKTLTDAGITVVPDLLYGGHNWHVWRQLLADFLTKTAFRPLPWKLVE